VTPAKGKTAIVYFSQTGNTRTACEIVAKKLSADVFELKIAKPPAAKGQLPVIEPATIDLDPYSFIVVASPIWAGKLVPAVQAFLKNNSLEGRRVAVLTTTNLAMPEQFHEKSKKFVTDAGGMVAGYYQVAVQKKQGDKSVARSAADIQKDTAIVADGIRSLVKQ
jgi:flavodoxin